MGAKATQLNTNVANIEQMNIAGDYTGNGDYFASYLNRSDLTPAEQITYDNCTSLFLDKAVTNVINTNSELDIDRVTSNAVDIEGEQIVDFQLLSPADQQKLADFLALAVSKGTV